MLSPGTAKSSEFRRLAFRGYDAGFNNCKMSMDLGIALAYLEDRRLVPYGLVPPWSPAPPRVGPATPRCITSAYDLFEVPVDLDLTHLEQTRPPVGVLCDWGALYDSVFHRLTPQQVHNDERLQHFRNGRSQLLAFDEPTRAAPDVVVDGATLSSYEHFFYLDADTARDLATVMSRVQPLLPYRRLARLFAAAIGRYHAVHVRRGDFVTQSYTPRSAQVSCEEIAANLLQVLDPETPLALCTDADDLDFFAPLFRIFPRAFLLERDLLHTTEWRSRFDALPFNDDHALSVLVQQIASLAETFVGTLCSSFTSEIQRTRGIRGDARALYCYNDWPGHAGVCFERCEFLPTHPGPYTWNRIRFPVAAGAYSWLRVWPEAFVHVSRTSPCSDT